MARTRVPGFFDFSECIVMFTARRHRHHDHVHVLLIIIATLVVWLVLGTFAH